MASNPKREVNFANKMLTLLGPQLKAGDKAPEFTAICMDLSPLPLSSIHVPVKIISSVPSLDTGVCSKQTKTFEEELIKLGDKVALVTVSMDLPFAQKRWCAGEPPPHAFFLSDHKDASFGTAYGTLIKENRLLSRAVFVVDSKGIIVHAQYVKDTGTHPNYGEVLKAVGTAIKNI